MEPTITTEEKFFLITKCLSEAGSNQELWAQAKTEAILLEERNLDGVLVEIGEKSKEAFDHAILRFSQLATQGEWRQVEKVYEILLV